MTATKKWAMYIDGYNFYYAIKNNRAITPIHLSWCDFGALARDMIGSRGSLKVIKYFTAPVGDFGLPGGDEGSERARQKKWLRAVRTISDLEVVEGFHTRDFPAASSQRQKFRNEKETDVNIAIALVLDAAKLFYDCALLVTGDCDQIPAVKSSVLRVRAGDRGVAATRHGEGTVVEFRGQSPCKNLPNPLRDAGGSTIV